MTFDDALKIPNNSPIVLNDGAVGLVVRWWKPGHIGAQVPGEDDIRRVNVENVVNSGNYALYEVLQNN